MRSCKGREGFNNAILINVHFQILFKSKPDPEVAVRELQKWWNVKNRSFAKEDYLLHKDLQAVALRDGIYKHKVALLWLGRDEKLLCDQMVV